MVKDAEAHAEEDSKFHEMVETRNQADACCMPQSPWKRWATRGRAPSQIEAAMEELKEAMKGDSKKAIEAKTKALAEASGKLAEKVYAKTSGDGAAGSAGAADAAGASASAGGGDDVVDAEFEEVKDDDKK